jgi:DNA polymerase-3 subunit gamma/tau
MAYLSLYRKYRSQSFDEVSGQDHVTRTLQNAIRTDRVAHAYLFCGARGTGKTTTARLLAKCINCEQGPTPTPCNACDNCLRIASGSSMDVIEIDAASNRGIDEIRTLREKVQYAPSQSRRKVYVLDEVHMLTTEAFNALLKTLEEPPAHVLFVLATTEAHKVPATILSRCQRFDFRRGSLEQIAARLRYVAEAEGYSIEPAALQRIARGADGSWRDALSLLEQVLAYGERTITVKDVTEVLGTVDADAIHALAEALRAGDGAALFGTIDALISAGKDPRQLTRDLVEHFRAMLRAAAGAATEAAAEDPRLARQAAAFGLARLVRGLEQLAQVEKDARWSDQSRLALEVALVRLMQGQPLPPAPSPERGGGETGPSATAPPVPSQRGTETPPANAPPSPLRGGGPGGRGPSDPFAPDDETDVPPPPAEPTAIEPEEAETQEPPAPPSTPVAASEAPGLAAIQARWGVVVEELKRRKAVSISALLADAKPVRLEGESLVVGFQFSPHVELFERKPENRQQLEAALESVLGARYRVHPAVLKTDSGDGAGSGGTGDPDMLPRNTRSAPPQTTEAAGAEAPAADRLIHEVIAIFNGKILDD